MVRVLPDAGLAIRAAVPSDASFIGQLSRQAFGEYDPSAERTTSKMMLEAGARTLLVERDGQALGFVILRAEENGVLALNAIAVLARERGRGVGKQLMRATEHYARSCGLHLLSLNTAQANLAALDLFLRSGFVITERHAVRYWRGQPACKLVKRLR